MKQTQIRVKKRNGTLAPYDPNKINKCAIRACEGLDGVSASELILDSQLNIFDKITTEEIDRTLLLKAREKMYLEPNWGLVASRILVSCVYKEVMNESVDSDTFDSDYRAAFIKNIKKGVKAGILSERLLNFDLKRLAAKIVPERDNTIDYVGMQNLADRYFLRDRNKKLLETPQAFYMRVAMGVSIPEFDFGKMDANDVAEKLYEIYSLKLASPSTPTLFNAGTNKNQLISCFLSNIPDSIDGIFDSLWQEARKSKHAGGLGFHVGGLRGTGSYIKGTNGKSSGIIPWLKLYNDMLIGVNQSGLRNGSGCAYIEPWHIDVEEFLDLRKSNGEERRRCHDLNTALWCSDIFFKRIQEDGQWTLLCPSECPDLTELYGEEFEKRYVEYEKMLEEGKLKLGKKIKAKDLWKACLKSLFETSHAWITYKDPSNKRYSNKHQGVIHGSNLCCISGEDRAYTNLGILKIKDLVGKSVNKSVGINGEVNTTQIVKTLYNQKVFKITTTKGFEHTVTSDHPLWVDGIGWVNCSDLKIGDVVLLQQNSIFGTKNLVDEALLAGAIIGDGTYSKGTARVILYEEEEYNDLNLIFENAFKNILSLMPKLDIRTSLTPSFYKEKTHYGNRWSIQSNGVAERFASLGWVGKDSDYRVPDFVFSGDKDTQEAFLSSLFAADGFLLKGKRKLLGITSKSKNLLKDCQLLLLNLGILSSIKKHGDGGLQDFGTGGIYNTSPSWQLIIFSKTDILKFISFSDKLCRWTKNLPEVIKTLSVGRIRKIRKTDTIKSIEFQGNEDVYCLKVLDSANHDWTCQGLITKNTEIFLHNKPSQYEDGVKTEIGETAVCCLSSINIANHSDDKGKVDKDKVADTVKWLIRALDNVIEQNYYPTKEAEKSAKLHRALGLGCMANFDLYAKKGIPCDSDKAVEIADQLFELISYNAINASADLARERGNYPTFEGSEWSKGIVPIDNYEGDIGGKGKLDWDRLREKVKGGIRNSNLMAVAPNASIAYQHGCEQSHEPIFSVIFRYENKSGNYYIVNRHFIDDMKREGIWSSAFAEAVKAVDGDVTQLDIPQKYKDLYKKCFDRDMFKLIDACAARQKWVDQGLSFNLYNGGTSLKYLNDIYMHCWKRGLKSTYYLRNKPASKVAAVTTISPIETEEERKKREAAEINAIFDRGRKAAEAGEACESCQG